MSEKIRAMLPAKNAVDALQSLIDDEPVEEQPPEVDEAELMMMSPEQREEYQQNQQKKKKEKKLNDPLDEDLNQPILFDFVQCTPMMVRNKLQLGVLIEAFVPQEIINRAENAMEVVRTRAEAAATGQNIPSGMQEDPALLKAG